MELRDEGYDNAQRLDFDYAVMDWWTQFEGLRREQKQVPIPKLKQGYTLGPRYANDKAILDVLMGAGAAVLDPVLEGVTADDLMDLMDGWDDASA